MNPSNKIPPSRESYVVFTAQQILTPSPVYCLVLVPHSGNANCKTMDWRPGYGTKGWPGSFGKLPLAWIQGRLQLYFLKRKLCFASERSMGRGWVWTMGGRSGIDLWLYYTGFFLMFTSVWSLQCQTWLKTYTRERSKFYCFPNPSGNLSVLLSSCCSARMDEWTGAQPAEWAQWGSQCTSLGRVLKDENGKMGRGLPCGFYCASHWRAGLVPDFSSMNPASRFLSLKTVALTKWTC
jgi:hypothetical protein